MNNLAAAFDTCALHTEGDWRGWVGFLLEGMEAVAGEAERSMVANDTLSNADRRGLLAAMRVSAVATPLYELLPFMPRFTTKQVRQRLEATFPTTTLQL